MLLPRNIPIFHNAQSFSNLLEDFSFTHLHISHVREAKKFSSIPSKNVWKYTKFCVLIFKILKKIAFDSNNMPRFISVS